MKAVGCVDFMRRWFTSADAKCQAWDEGWSGYAGARDRDVAPGRRIHFRAGGGCDGELGAPRRIGFHSGRHERNRNGTSRSIARIGTGGRWRSRGRARTFRRHSASFGAHRSAGVGTAPRRPGRSSAFSPAQELRKGAPLPSGTGSRGWTGHVRSGRNGRRSLIGAGLPGLAPRMCERGHLGWLGEAASRGQGAPGVYLGVDASEIHRRRISSRRRRLAPRSEYPTRDADRQWMTPASGSMRNSTSSTNRQIRVVNSKCR